MPEFNTPNDPAALAAFAAQSLVQLRAAAPLVQCITNRVASGFTANVLLALGAAPAMVDLPGEAEMFAGIASATLINLGTPVPAQAETVVQTARAASAAGKPWVLDPVAIGALPLRTQLAADLLALRPPIVRGNASEILALAGQSAGGRGVDATDSVERAQHAAIALAQQHGCVVAVSGPIDFLTDGHTHWQLGNGSALLTRITGGGCALGAVMAAFAALAGRGRNDTSDRASDGVGDGASNGASDGVSGASFADALPALTAAAVLCYTIAAEIAAESSTGPGSFAVHLLDQLALIEPDTVRARANIRMVQC